MLGEDSKIFGLKNANKLKRLIRRKNLEYNKLYQKKTFSYGSLVFELKNTTFQDRLIIGGNSEIWGGKINIKGFSSNIIKILSKKINFRKLSYKITGTVSNKRDIFQMQNKEGKIISSSDFNFNIKNSYLKTFKIKKKKILLNFQKKKISTNSLYICVGVIQLLDLLYRSNFLRENDQIELSEFYSEFKFNTIYSKMSNKFTIQRFLLSRAIGHYLGVQHYSKFLKFFDFIPICIDQNFYKKKRKIKLKLKNGVLINKTNSHKEIFGKSTHFCNLKINNININKFLSDISPNIKGVGMAFVNQKIPGPISNDIILDIFKKINFKKK